MLDVLCMQLLLQFYADSFETLQVLRSYGLKMCIWFGNYPPIIYFCFFFQKLSLVAF